MARWRGWVAAPCQGARETKPAIGWLDSRAVPPREFVEGFRLGLGGGRLFGGPRDASLTSSVNSGSMRKRKSVQHYRVTIFRVTGPAGSLRLDSSLLNDGLKRRFGTRRYLRGCAGKGRSAGRAIALGFRATDQHYVAPVLFAFDLSAGNVRTRDHRSSGMRRC
jgi:hypothetical protein